MSGWRGPESVNSVVAAPIGQRWRPRRCDAGTGRANCTGGHGRAHVVGSDPPAPASRLVNVHFDPAPDPGLHGSRRNLELLGGPVHRQSAQAERRRLNLERGQCAAWLGGSEAQSRHLARTSLLAGHEAALACSSPTHSFNRNPCNSFRHRSLARGYGALCQP